MTRDRISLPADSELDEKNREFLQTVPPFNVWRMLAGTGIAPSFAVPLAVIFDPEWFPVEDREILLFRTCRENHSQYEIPQHREFGTVPPRVVDAILDDRLDQLTPWQRRLCELADEMAHRAKLSAESVQELVDHYGSQATASRAILVMAWFNMLTRFVDSTGVPIEDSPVGKGVDTRGPVAHPNSHSQGERPT